MEMSKRELEIPDYFDSVLGGVSVLGGRLIEGEDESSITGTLSSFLAKRKERRREKRIKLNAVTLVVLVSMSALEEPKAVWLAPPIMFIAFPPLPD